MQEHVAHCFSVRIELVFEKNTCWRLGISRWRYALFAPKVFSGELKNHMCLSKRKQSVLEAAAATTLIPWRIELVFERNISCKSVFNVDIGSVFST
jgi:hypothetical protein